MTLKLSNKEWSDILIRIRKEHGISIQLSWKLKETLGFTVRRHRYYDSDKGHTVSDIRLDFYNQAAITFFQLKYL